MGSGPRQTSPRGTESIGRNRCPAMPQWADTWFVRPRLLWIAPRVQYAKAATLIGGPPIDALTPVTTKVDWSPLYSGPEAEQDVLSVASAYYSGPKFWLTASGATGKPYVASASEILLPRRQSQCVADGSPDPLLRNRNKVRRQIEWFA